MADREEFARRQRALARFGELVLDSDDLHEILTEGCRLVAEALGTDLAKVLEIDQAAGTAFVRAGFGWNEDIIGNACVELNDRSSEAYAIEQGEPVVTQDIAEEARFEYPDFMKRHGVTAIVNVPIFLPGRKPFGLLQVDSRRPRAFDQEDVEFLKTYAMVLGPVIDRLQKVGQINESDERLRLIVENARDYVIVLSDADDIITDWFPGAVEILGWTREEAIGQPVSLFFTDEDKAHGVPRWEIETALRDGAAPDIRWHQRKDGSRVFLDGQTIAICKADGSVRGFLKIGQDITERHRTEERQHVLLAELQHRVRNVLAMVRAVIQRGEAETVDDFRAHLEGRVTAMARTQALLTRGANVGVDLDGVVREELLAQAADERRIQVEGPPVNLAPKAAEVLTLAIHELATNAIKYGALQAPKGRVEVTWRTAEEGGKTWLHLTWRETGVPRVASSPRRDGFGTELITRRVPYDLRGRGKLEHRPGGLRCEISFPLVPGESVLQTDEPAVVEDEAPHE